MRPEGERLAVDVCVGSVAAGGEQAGMSVRPSALGACCDSRKVEWMTVVSRVHI